MMWCKMCFWDGLFSWNFKLYWVHSTLHLENSISCRSNSNGIWKHKILPHNGDQRINNWVDITTKHTRWQYLYKERLWRKELKLLCWWHGEKKRYKVLILSLWTYNMSVRYTTKWFSIHMSYDVITTISVVTICHPP